MKATLKNVLRVHWLTEKVSIEYFSRYVSGYLTNRNQSTIHHFTNKSAHISRFTFLFSYHQKSPKTSASTHLCSAECRSQPHKAPKTAPAASRYLSISDHRGRKLSRRGQLHAPHQQINAPSPKAQVTVVQRASSSSAAAELRGRGKKRCDLWWFPIYRAAAPRRCCTLAGADREKERAAREESLSKSRSCSSISSVGFGGSNPP